MKIEEKNGRLTITDFNELEAYKIACKIENDGISFYGKLREGIKDPRASELIDFLIGEERKHLKLFSEWLEGLDIEDGFEGDDLLRYIDYGIFAPYKEIKDLKDIIVEPARAIRLGISIEGKSIEFYESIKDKVSGDSTKFGLQRIIEEEKGHKRLLEELLLYVSGK